MMTARTHPTATGRRRHLAAAVAAAGLLTGVAACSTGNAQQGSDRDRPAVSPTGPVPPGPSVDASRDDPLDAALRVAAWENRVADAATLIERGADVNAKGEDQQSAYLVATSEGHLDLLDLALRSGAVVNDKDSWNGTGLIRAAERGHHDVVGRLLRAGIDKDHVNRIGYQAVHEAVWFGTDSPDHVDTLRVLVAGGVQLDRPSRTEGLTPLAMARHKGLRELEAVLEKATSAPVPSDPDRSLLTAAAAGDADLVALALRAGADIETRDDRGRTPLLLAVSGDHLPVARVLVDLLADPDALDDQHDTPWLVTGVTGSVGMLEVLLARHPDLRAVNRFGGVSLIPASERGHVEYVRRVVQTDIDVNHVNDLGWTALLEAVILGDGGPDHREIVRILLDAGADPSIPDREGRTALDHAEAKGQGAVAQLLRR